MKTTEVNSFTHLEIIPREAGPSKKYHHNFVTQQITQQIAQQMLGCQ